LDPLATGVLIAGIGKGTKVLNDFLKCTKTYETVILFGASTDTYDRVGKILKRAPYKHITREMVEKALGQFRGTIMQLPPLYSALKMNGKPLYEYAREGKEIPREIERRQVTVEELELVDWMEGGTHEHEMPKEEAGGAEKDVAEKLWKVEKEQEAREENKAESLEQKKRKLEDRQDELVSERPVSKRRTSNAGEASEMSGGLEAPVAELRREEKEVGPPAAKIRMTVTSGFYVRSLCHDLGQAVGSQAMMAELIRTRQGQFELGINVLKWEDLAKGEDVWGPQVEAMLDSWSGEYRPFVGKATEAVVGTGTEVEAKTETEETKETNDGAKGETKEDSDAVEGENLAAQAS